MTYEQALDFIHGIPRMAKRPGLERIRQLMARMGDPQEKFRCIHVAGTNGKGSTCTMLSHIYTAAGYRTGLYISPFVVDFRERIQVDNEMIGREELVAGVERVKLHWDAMAEEGEAPSEFEVVVAVAFDYFCRSGCDIVVLEVGMGGRFDATNVIAKPLASVITSIGIDHVAFLGDTLEKIAAEKCGIIKPDGVTVSYHKQEPEALAVIMEQCALKNNRLLMGGHPEVLEMDVGGSVVRYGELELHIPLPGKYQVWNAVTVLETVKAVGGAGFAVEPDEIAKGIGAARFPARMEVLCRQPLILLDGAHNLPGIRALKESLKLIKDKNIHCVVGMMEDKEVENCLAEILPLCQTATVTSPALPKAMPAKALAVIAKKHCAKVEYDENAAGAFHKALAHCGKNDALLLFGSLYLAGELRPMVLEYTGHS